MRWIAVTIAALGVIALLWMGSEMHYQGCVNAADKATIPSKPGGNDFFNEVDSQRKHRIAGCSRLPF